MRMTGDVLVVEAQKDRENSARHAVTVRDRLDPPCADRSAGRAARRLDPDAECLQGISGSRY
jgi:hypothetical protein